MNARPFLLCALTLALAAPLGAQDVKSALIDDFQRQRANVLAMVDAMPAEGLRTAPTEGVRDFAQQIEHVAVGNVSIIRSGVDRPLQLEGFDAEVYLNDKDELKRMVNAAYDLVVQMIEAVPTSAMTEETPMFGQANVERWKLIKAAHEHGVWTLGAVVPYVRLEGSTPGAYNLIPG